MEAECVKYVRNCFLATKVSFFNEIFSLCEKLNINYNNIRDGIITDQRINSSHTIVPNEEFFNGHVAIKKGFGGTCFIKDMSSLMYTMKTLQVPCPILESVFFRNYHIDRPEHDWLSDIGRVITKN
jgi:UDPglucose 6-dehydrogenase